MQLKQASRFFYLKGVVMLKLVGNKTKCALFISSILGAAFTAQADIQLNGYASIRGTNVSSDGGGEPFPGFKEGSFSFKPESLFALQARADMGEKLSATVQIYADGQDDFNAKARWAYISYELTDNHRISAGLFANPLFHQSEYEKVGYVHNFARLPKAVYIGFDFSTVEGIALDSTFEVAGLNASTKLLYGNWDGQTYFSVTDSFVDFALADIMSANFQLSGDWWSIFAGGLRAEADAETLDNQTIFLLAQPGINAALANGATDQEIAQFKDSIKSNGKNGTYVFAGVSIDYEDWLFDVEYVDYGILDSVNAANSAWFTALGRRFGSVTLTVHKEDYSREQNEYGFLNGVTHPALIATGRSLKDAFSQREFDGVGVDLRWDFHPSAALKLDFFQGTDTRPTIGDYTITSIGVDLTF